MRLAPLVLAAEAGKFVSAEGRCIVAFAEAVDGYCACLERVGKSVSLGQRFGEDGAVQAVAGIIGHGQRVFI